VLFIVSRMNLKQPSEFEYMCLNSRVLVEVHAVAPHINIRFHDNSSKKALRFMLSNRFDFHTASNLFRTV